MIKITKFQPKANDAIFLAYSAKSKAYRVLNRWNRVIGKSFDVTFDENYVQNSGPNHVIAHIMESDAPTPGCPNTQVIHEFNFETLFGPS